MKKIKINQVIKAGESETTVGKLLHDLLEGIPTDNAKEAIRQLQIADELKLALDGKKEWFSFEDAELALIERVVDIGAKSNGPRLIAPIRIAIDEAESFKGEEPKEK